MTWSDPLYRRRDELPGTGEAVTSGGVAVEVTVTDTDPGLLAAQWTADRDVALVVTDDVGPAALAAVLPDFLARAASLADRPTEATVLLPSRDVERGRVAREAGLHPSSILAVAPLDRTCSTPASSDVVVRDAATADTQAVAGLWIEQAEYEARVGTLRVSDAIRTSIRAAAAQAVEGTSTVLVAERHGDVLGAVVAESAAESVWAGARLALDPISYLSMASTSARARGGGIGTAVVAELHRRHRADGIAASVLHHGAVNPLSVPFWSQQGYRPLVTTYTRRVRS